MAQALVITLEKPLAEAQAVYEKAGSGKALMRELERVDSAARRRGVEMPSALVSESQAALIEQMKEEGFDPAKMRIPPERWYAAGEGLRTVRMLAEHVTANLNDFKQPNPILRDLKAAEALLVVAEGAGVQFHFTKATV
jgi:hypothetical protein